ncbi:MAG: D-alanyl-D-alanine carboxypeptidase family protein [Clostridia bacterium]
MGRLDNVGNKCFKIIKIISLAIVVTAIVFGVAAINFNSNFASGDYQLKGVDYGVKIYNKNMAQQEDIAVNNSLCPQVVMEQNSNAYMAQQEDIAVNNTLCSQVVMEQNSHMVLRSKNANVRMEMASTTKLVTALVVLENIAIDSRIVVPKEAVGIEGSSIYLRQGQDFSAQDLLYGLMLRSGNDSAVALAIATAGSVTQFVDMMNAKAAALGLKNTHFENPHGLSHSNHFTTAYELGILACEAMKIPTFCTIVASKSYVVEKNETHERILFVNKNKMLSSFEGANGIKTGYTTHSGRCLVSAAKRGDMQLVCVALNDYNMWEDSKALMRQVFDEYVAVNIGDKDDCKWSVPLSESCSVDICLKDSIVFPMKKNQKVNLSFEIKIDKNMTCPLVMGAEIGKIFIYNDKCLLFEQKIITMKEITKRGDLVRLSNFVGDLSLEDYNGEIKQIFGCKRCCIA